MWGLITDGSTIALSIMQVGVFGGIFGGAAAGAVAIPMITYNQIIKAEIRGLEHARDLLNESAAMNVEGKQIKKMFKKLRWYNLEMAIEPLMEEINDANSKNQFCPEGERPDYLFQIRKFLKPRSNEEAKELFLLSTIETLITH